MKHNEENERIKRAYRLHMKAARGLSDASIDVASAAIHRFEENSAFALRAFFLWLAEQPGYRSRIRFSDADNFRLSEKDTRVAKATKPRPVPTPEQIECVLERSPVATVIGAAIGQSLPLRG